MKTWKLSDAKNKLSEVVDKAMTEGPQQIERNGRAVVVVIERQELAKLLPMPLEKAFDPPPPLEEILAKIEKGAKR